MRVFDHPNLLNDWKCKICGTGIDKPIVLIGIEGTEDGRNIQADQYHLHCIDLKEIKIENNIWLVQPIK
jgi:hypothetical protein